VPIIGFPRGAGALAEEYALETGIDAIGCDTSMPLGFMRETLQKRLPVQGNLDPLLLLAGGGPMERRVAAILNTLGGAPFVFNLGHGVVPDTPPEHVARLVELVKGIP
jgi:uroporphyrinogen decarboxylase